LGDGPSIGDALKTPSRRWRKVRFNLAYSLQ
jgi:hypothetical protein